jgi:hypothetical protein
MFDISFWSGVVLALGCVVFLPSVGSRCASRGKGDDSLSEELVPVPVPVGASEEQSFENNADEDFTASEALYVGDAVADHFYPNSHTCCVPSLALFSDCTTSRTPFFCVAFFHLRNRGTRHWHHQQPL